MNYRVIQVISGAVSSLISPAQICEGNGEQLPPPGNHC